MGPLESVKRRWMLYALGGGLGHLTRVLAFARAIVRPRADSTVSDHVCLLTNSPFAHLVPIAQELGADAHELIKIPAGLSRDETEKRVHAALKSRDYDLLVVDTFPRGLGGELETALPQLSCPKILIHRDLSPKYCAAVDLVPSIREYDRLVMPGESAPFCDSSHAVLTAPWLMRDSQELLVPAAARKLLQVDSSTLPVVVVIGCGQPNEIGRMRKAAVRLAEEFIFRAAIRFATLTDTAHRALSVEKSVTLHLWPLLQAIRGVDVVIGSGGYNTVNECVATRTPLIGIAQQRLYDRQELRLRSCNSLVKPGRLAEKLNEFLITARPHNRVAPVYENGVHEA
ncbi:MAG: hypothetical protein GY758_31970, partial [Fuerstiella sp.]|nr:hypothetical protein [Fuerstiella sp.]